MKQANYSQNGHCYQTYYALIGVVAIGRTAIDLIGKIHAVCHGIVEQNVEKGVDGVEQQRRLWKSLVELYSCVNLAVHTRIAKQQRSLT